MKHTEAGLFRATGIALSLLGSFVSNAFADTLVIYGASGNVGSVIVDEALSRGHEVVGVSRTPEILDVENALFSAVQGDVTDPDSIVATIEGADAVIISVTGIGPGNTPEEAITFRSAMAYIQAASELGDATPYVIQVGSGSTLFTDGERVMDTLGFVEPGTVVHGQFHGHWLAMEAYQDSDGFEWTVMSPSFGAIQERGEYTGRYRLGDQETLFDRNGETYISRQDFAIAVIDMAESHTITAKRVAVGPAY